MEALVDEQNNPTVVAHSPGDRVTSVVSSGSGVDGSTRTITATAAQVRANGTVVFTSPAPVKQVVTSASTPTQAIAVPQPGGTVSIVHLSIPNQPMHVQSVIQPPNQQSVIQAPSGATLQSLPKNVILLNKVSSQGSVIHSTEGEGGVHPVQLISASKTDSDSETLVASLATMEDDSKKRREVLARRPSYRKILSDLSSTDVHGTVTTLTSAANEVKEETIATNGRTEVTEDSESGGGTLTVAGTQYHTTGLLKVVPASAIQLTPQDGSIQGLQTLTVGGSGSGTSAIVQYAQGQDGQIFVPVTVSATDLQAYQIRTSSGTPTSALAQGVVMATPSNLPPQQLAEEASRKRELRLLKNREAAKECRRKKKEYIKCLENRVAVLENQNKALIEELKSLKELYCQKNE